MTRAAAFHAFAAVHARHHRAVWAYLVRLGASAATAEDLTQEAFVRWIDHGSETSRPGQVRAFRYTTATRLLTDHWRRERRWVQWDEALPEPAVEPAGENLFDSRAWAGLSQRERQMLWLAYGEEFSHAEIATITGLAPDSIKVLLSRARAHLKSRLEAAGGERD